MKKYFSKNRRVLLDRLTGQIINTNSVFQISERFYGFEQTIEDSIWEINHNSSNVNYLIDVYVLQLDGTHKKIIPYKEKENNRPKWTN